MESGLLPCGQAGHDLFIFFLIGQVVVPAGLVFHHSGAQALDGVGDQHRRLIFYGLRFRKGGGQGVIVISVQQSNTRFLRLP